MSPSNIVLVLLSSLMLADAAHAQEYGPPAEAQDRSEAEAAGAGGLNASQLLGADAVDLGASVGLAAHSYPTVLAARANIRGAQANVKGANWQRFPSVSVEALGLGSGAGSSDYSFRVDEPLWTAGRIGGSIRLSKAQLAAAEAALSEVQLDISLRVLTAYFDVQRLTAREAILEESLREHVRLVESMARRVQQELSAASDLDLAKTRAAQVQQDLVLAGGQRRASLNRLRELTGLATVSVRAVKYDPLLHHPAADGLVDEALAFDPRRRRLQAELLAADADITVRRAAIFPQVSLQYQKPFYGPDNIGVVLRAQSAGGLSQLSAVDAARQRRTSAEFAIASSERELREAVEADLLENGVAKDRIASSGTSVLSAQAVTDSFMRQFVAGRRTWLDVMNAVRESTAAQLAEVDARVSATASAGRILLRTGRWLPQSEQDDSK